MQDEGGRICVPTVDKGREGKKEEKKCWRFQRSIRLEKKKKFTTI